MRHGNIFMDMIHVKMNLSRDIGAEKGHAPALYESAVRAPSFEKFGQLGQNYWEKQRTYRVKFIVSEF